MIRRTEHSAEKRYAIISRKLAQDSNLSFEARGILLYILSKPSNWKARDTDLQKEGKLGEKRVAAALRELKKHGYFRRYRARGKKGRFTYENEVLEEPEPLENRTPYTEDGTALPLPPHGEGSTVLIDKDVRAQADLSIEKEDTEKEIAPPAPAWTKAQNERSIRLAANATRYTKADDTPAIIRAIAKVASNWKPDKDLWPALAEQFPDDQPIDEPLLKQSFTEWRLRGWRKENLGWLVEWYAQGGPKERESNGTNTKPTKAPILDCNGAVITADYGSYYFVESCNGDGGTSPRWRTAAGMAQQQGITLEEVYERRPKEHWTIPIEKYPYHEDTIGGGSRPITVW